MKAIGIFILAVLLTSCYGINSETSEIGSINLSCLDSLAWEKMCQEHSIDSIKDPALIRQVDNIKQHFTHPTYILHFKNDPEEIIGCNWSSVRIAYNAKVSWQPVTGLSQELGNAEQKRIRNRVLSELMKYQCSKGKIETSSLMKEDVPFAESHEKYPLF
jgi:hypothetical protein